ncbi:hypothetical protein GQ42DRAFT_162912 [Ramicandelaber brevisporus]|nr:hypothetical protein GQ42DRAFT_162912 [Ramicandelaber brevisporus]
MKLRVLFAASLATTVLLLSNSAISSPAKQRAADKNTCNGDPNVDNFPVKATLTSTADIKFSIEYFKTYKVVHNEFSSETYGLYCGENQPTVSETPGGKRIIQWFKLPLDVVAIEDNTAIAFMEALQLLDKVKYVAEPSSVTSACWMKSPNANNPAIANLTLEQSGSIDVGFVDRSSISTKKAAFWSQEKYLLTPLQRFEWIKYIAAFFNAEGTANDIYEKVAGQYICHKTNMAGVVENGKQVAWVAHQLTPAQYRVLDDKYTVELMTDAGMKVLKPPAPKTVLADANAVKPIINSADIIIDSSEYQSGIGSFGRWQELFGYTDNESKSSVKFMHNEQVWRPDLRVNSNHTSDWFQSAGVRPDLALLDLITLQYPNYNTKYTKRWMENFSKGDRPNTIDKNNCQNPPELSNFKEEYACITGAFHPLDDPNGPKPPPKADVNGNNNNSSDQQGSSKNTLVWTIVGVVIAGVIVFGVVMFIRRRNIKRRQTIINMITIRANMSSPTNDQDQFTDDHVRRPV